MACAAAGSPPKLMEEGRFCSIGSRFESKYISGGCGEVWRSNNQYTRGVSHWGLTTNGFFCWLFSLPYLIKKRGKVVSSEKEREIPLFSNDTMDHLTQEQKNVFRGIFNFLSGTDEPKQDLEAADIKQAMRNLHMNPTDAEVKEMMTQVGGGTMNFTNFCNLMGKELQKLDAKEDISQAFECFDSEGKGTMPVEEFRQILMADGDFTDREVREFLRLAGASGDTLNYNDLVDKMLGSLS